MTPDIAAIHASLKGRSVPTAIAAVRGSQAAHATFGAGAGADFEIGSVSKGLTGLLLAEARSRGEVSEETRLEDLLPLRDAPLGDVRLDDIAIHMSVIPPQPKITGERSMARRVWRLMRHGENPYGDTLEELFTQVRETPAGKPGYVYSNLGFELLGHALGAAAGMSYSALLTSRLCDPLGMSSTHAPAVKEELRAESVTGVSRRGRAREPWTGEAIAPAGGVRATAADLEALLRGLVGGTAPGISALDPVAQIAKGARIGAGWLTTELRDGAVTWHNGQTGGFASWVGINRAHGTAVAIVRARGVGFDRAGFAALDSLSA